VTPHGSSLPPISTASSIAPRSTRSRRTCPPARGCRAELAALEQLRNALRAAPRLRAPAQLRRRLAQMDELPRLGAPAHGAWRAGWWAMAASLLLGLALGAGFMTWRVGAPVAEGHLLARDLLASHLRALAASSPLDVISEDRHTVKPWFAGKIGESPPVIDPKVRGISAAGWAHRLRRRAPHGGRGVRPSQTHHRCVHDAAA
jgi:anti-sigma factor RsiW